MLLRCLAGRYAGEVLDYSTVAALAALRTGMAARLPDASLPSSAVVVAVKKIDGNAKHAAKRRERGQ